MGLYDISEALAMTVDLIENGEVTEEEMQDTKDALNKELMKSTGTFIKYNTSNNSDIISVDAEIERLQLWKKKLQARKEYYKGIVLNFMEDNKIKRLTSALGDISLGSAESVSVPDVTKVDDKWFDTKITKTISKVRIKKAIKSGERVNGALVIKKSNVRGLK